jgi:hypothetical protein
MMDTCPSCKKSSKLGWRKATMSPLAPMPCESCDTELTVTWKAYLLSALPASILFLSAYLFMEEESLEQYGAYAVSIAVMVLCQLYLMPIVERVKPEESNKV